MDLSEWLNDRDRTHWEGCEEHHIRCAVAAEIARLTRERDEAIKVAVWAAEMNVGAYSEFRNAEGERHAWIEWTHDRGEGDEVYVIEYDGTDADIYRALKEARNGEV